MKRISKRIKRSVALLLAAALICGSGAPFTLLDILVASATELVPDGSDLTMRASEGDAPEDDETKPEEGTDEEGTGDNAASGDEEDLEAEYVIKSIKALKSSIRTQEITEEDDIYGVAELPEYLEAKNELDEEVELYVDWVLRNEEDIEEIKAGDVLYFDAELNDIDYVLMKGVKLPSIRVNVKASGDADKNEDLTTATMTDAPEVNKLQLKSLVVSEEDGIPVYTVTTTDELKEAYELIGQQEEGSEAIVIFDFDKNGIVSNEIGVDGRRITYRSENGYIGGRTINLNGDCIIDGNVIGGYPDYVYANGYYFELTDNFTSSIWKLYGAKESGTVDKVDLVLNGGKIDYVYACGDSCSVEGDVNIVVDGCEIYYSLYAAGTVDDDKPLSNDDASVGGDVNIEFLSGTIGHSSSDHSHGIYGGGVGFLNDDETVTRKVAGDITITIGYEGAENNTAEAWAIYGGGKYAYANSVEITINDGAYIYGMKYIVQDRQ